MILKIIIVILIVMVIVNRIAIKNIGNRVFDIETKNWFKKSVKQKEE